MRQLALVLLIGCGSHETNPPGGSIDAPISIDAAVDTPPQGVPLMGFGDLAGMCGVLNDPELTGATPMYFSDSITFSRRYNDPADRPLLTTGGQTLAATPNAGGSSSLSEVFAFEELARCELAGLLKTETQITYSTTGKITDMLVEIDGKKIGVSVTRAVQFPFGTPYTLTNATTLIQRKLEDIQASSANVAPADKWVKQILAVLAYDDQHANTVMQAWLGLDATVRADTVLVVTTTHGDDAFIYTNQ